MAVCYLRRYIRQFSKRYAEHRLILTFQYGVEVAAELCTAYRGHGKVIGLTSLSYHIYVALSEHRQPQPTSGVLPKATRAENPKPSFAYSAQILFCYHCLCISLRDGLACILAASLG